MKYFVINDWKFGSDNFFELIDDLSPHDDDVFDVDMRKFRATGRIMVILCVVTRRVDHHFVYLYLRGLFVSMHYHRDSPFTLES